MSEKRDKEKLSKIYPHFLRYMVVIKKNYYSNFFNRYSNILSYFYDVHLLLLNKFFWQLYEVREFQNSAY